MSQLVNLVRELSKILQLALKAIKRALYFVNIKFLNVSVTQCFSVKWSLTHEWVIVSVAYETVLY